MLTAAILANVGIGLAFCNVALTGLYLWSHRRRDWPPAWVLLIVAMCMGTCGVDRLVRAWLFKLDNLHPPAGLVAADLVVAAASLPGSVMIWWGVRAIRRLPTPKDYAEMVVKADRTARAEAELLWVARRASIASQQVDAMRAMIADYASIDPALKERMLQIVEAWK